MKKLLVIDDDVVFAEVAADSLRRCNFTVMTANSAAAGLQRMNEFHADSVLLDLKIVSDSGLKMIPELVAANPAVKIVVLTGYANIQTAIEAIKLGAVYYLSKPATSDEIIAAFGKESGDSAVEIEDQTVPLNRLERNHIESVLAKNQGNISQAARELKMHRRTLQRKLSKKI